MDKGSGVSEEVTESQSVLDTASIIENSEGKGEQATDHIEILKSAIASASDELSSKMDGDSITASIDSVQDAATSVITQSLAEAVVVATSFLHF